MTYNHFLIRPSTTGYDSWDVTEDSYTLKHLLDWTLHPISSY